MKAPLEFLVQAPLLQNLSKTQIKALAAICERSELDPQETLAREGSPGTGAYLIERGIIEVVLESDGQRDVVGTLTGPEYKDDARGDAFGEICVLDPMPWQASFQTVENSVLWLLPHARLQALFAADPDLKARLASNVARALYRRLAGRTSG